jgi:hypothetical protein
MAKVNKKSTVKVVKKVAPKKTQVFTAGGAKAQTVNAKKQLQRSLMTTLLWENSFYEGGNSVAKRISDIIPNVHPNDVLDLALEAKDFMKLRHAPLYVIRELAKYTQGNLAKTGFPYKWNDVNVGTVVEVGVASLIKRPDELAEFLAMYWKDKKQPLSASVKRGLAKAFTKFDEYQLAKWNRDNDIKLRDVLFLSHAKPQDREQELLFKKLVDNTLKTPDTWEVALSSGANKKETWERLIRENKLGGFALLKNLRNMLSAGVDEKLIRERLEKGVGVALPFNFMTAAKYAPRLSKSIEIAMLKAIDGMDKLPGRTLLVVDTSGSMNYGNVSSKSEVSRLDGAAGLALLARNLCEESVVYVTAGSDASRKHATALVPDHLNGLALAEKIHNASHEFGIGGGGIFLVQCMEYIKTQKHQEFDRVIVFTDEQDCDTKANPALAPRLGKFNYVVNVSNEKNGISYKNGWDHIDGWSERIFDYIRVFETDAENVREA